MKDLKNIVTEYGRLKKAERKVALATVVRVRGSAYRSPGARMLIMDDGRWVGSISGGCLEGDALRKARAVMHNKTPLFVTYDTTEASNQYLGIGLGCNGIIDVLIEPVDDVYVSNPLPLFETIQQQTTSVVLATVFNCSDVEVMGKKILLNHKGQSLHPHADTHFAEVVTSDLQALFITKKSQTKSYFIHGKEAEVYLELIQPTLSLLIFGGGFDARPVSQLASSLGWTVTVTDECVAHIAPIFFPNADTLSLCKREFIDREINITPHTACVLMSHNYEYDRDVLKKILSTPTPYIGILGPRKRFEKMLDDFALEGIKLSEHDLQRIHSPIGLDIGAEIPEEIALAIISEVLCTFTERGGGFLKDKNTPIHQREGEQAQVYKSTYRGS